MIAAYIEGDGFLSGDILVLFAFIIIWRESEDLVKFSVR